MRLGLNLEIFFVAGAVLGLSLFLIRNIFSLRSRHVLSFSLVEVLFSINDFDSHFGHISGESDVTSPAPNPVGAVRGRRMYLGDDDDDFPSFFFFREKFFLFEEMYGDFSRFLIILNMSLIFFSF